MEKLNLPWHMPFWRHLESYIHQDRLPNALMISGVKGLGKRSLALAFATRILCENENACGICHACGLIGAGTHPDLLTIETEEGKPLTVDRIRALIETLELKPQYAQGRVVVIESADKMNMAAANSFLKTLEEPAQDTTILLLCEMPRRLPATIVSRCQHLKLTTPVREEAVHWLQSQGFDQAMGEVALALNGGAPLAALEWLNSEAVSRRNQFIEMVEQLIEGRSDPVALASAWQASSLEQIMVWLMSITADLIRLSQGYNQHMLNPDRQQWLQSQVWQLNLSRLFDFWQHLLEVRQGLDTQLNRVLLLESLFLQINRLRL